MSIEIDIQQVAADAARQLGAAHGETVLELTAMRAANGKLSARVEELEAARAEALATNELLQQRIRDLETVADMPADDEAPDGDV